MPVPSKSIHRRPSGDESRQRGPDTKRRLAVGAHGRTVRRRITESATADCSQVGERLEGLDADCGLADKAWDTGAIPEHCQTHDITPVMPPKRHCKRDREYDEYLYRHRRWVEKAFLWLKRWRGMATRQAKNSALFLAGRCARPLSGHLGEYLVI